MSGQILGVKPQDSVPDELRPYEPAARKYCELRGEGPDQIVITKMANGAELERVLWELAAEKLMDLSYCLVALRTTAKPVEGERLQ